MKALESVKNASRNAIFKKMHCPLPYFRCKIDN